MAEIEATCRVYARMDTGRFLDRLAVAERAAVRETVDEGMAVARALAPKKSGAMAASIAPTYGTSGGSWSVGTDHWRFTEDGAIPHKITGWVNFFWVREGRDWDPGPNTIKHPGIRARHFMRRSYKIAAPKLLQRIRRNLG
jgi:hypothetical protein